MRIKKWLLLALSSTVLSTSGCSCSSTAHVLNSTEACSGSCADGEHGANLLETSEAELT